MSDGAHDTPYRPRRTREELIRDAPGEYKKWLWRNLTHEDREEALDNIRAFSLVHSVDLSEIDKEYNDYMLAGGKGEGA